MNNKIKINEPVSREMVNGTVTSDSYKAYASLQSQKKTPVRKLIFTGLFLALISAAIVTFSFAIKRAYFEDRSDQSGESQKISTIDSYTSYGNYIQVETVTQQISQLFDIPVGLKIISLDLEFPLFTGLQANDIITSLSGTAIETLQDMDDFIKNLEDNSELTFTVFRNGKYHKISPNQTEETLDE